MKSICIIYFIFILDVIFSIFKDIHRGKGSYLTWHMMHCFFLSLNNCNLRFLYEFYVALWQVLTEDIWL